MMPSMVILAPLFEELIIKKVCLSGLPFESVVRLLEDFDALVAEWPLPALAVPPLGAVDLILLKNPSTASSSTSPASM